MNDQIVSFLRTREIRCGYLPQIDLKRFFDCLPIRQKIGYGYALAIGIAILGTITGRLIESGYKQQVKEQLLRNTEKAYLVTTLNSAVLEAKIYQQELIPLVAKPQQFKQESARLLSQTAEISQLLNQTQSINQFSNSQWINSAEQKDLEQLKRMAQDYADAVAAYSQQLEILLQDIDPATLKPEEVQALQQSLINFSNSSVSLKLNEFSQESAKLANQFRKQVRVAAKNYEEAEQLGGLILIVSLLVSAAIATLLAIQTSLAIARPLETTTKVAQRATAESNFNLQAPVTTQDEVGLLTTSLNQLIQRVDAHTGELNQKNRQLLQTHDQLRKALSDLQQTQAQLIQSEKMSSLGQLVAGIAHEINNPVNFIYGNLHHATLDFHSLLDLLRLYQQEYPIPTPDIQDKTKEVDLDFIAEDMPHMLSSMMAGAERIRQIVLFLRNFSGLDKSDVLTTDIHEGIDNTLLLLNHRLTGIEVSKNYGKLPLIECYSAQLNQTFLNILTNAIDALHSNGESAEQKIAIQTDTIGKQQVQIRIWNNGPEIPAKIHDKIFDPFFTTKPIGQGTGLGLSICYQIVKQHQGQIEVISQPGKGTEFIITIPTRQLMPIAV